MPKNRFVLLALAVPALVAGCGGGGQATKKTADATAAAMPAGPIKVALNEWAVDPQKTTAKAGKVTFDVTNTGKVEHEMVVVRTAKPAGGLMHGKDASEQGSVGEVAGLKAGQSKMLTLDLKPGHYALICNEPGHYMSGMHRDFRVTS